MSNPANQTHVDVLQLTKYASAPPAASPDSDLRFIAAVDNDLQYWNGSSWVALGSGGGGGDTLDSAYSNGRTITVDDGAVAMNGVDEDTAVLAITGDGDSGGALIKFTHSTATRNDILGTASSWLVTGQGKATFAAVTLGDDEPINFGATTDAVIQWVNASSYLDIAGAVNFDNSITMAASASLTIAGVDGSDMLVVTAGDVSVANGSVYIVDTDNAKSFSVINNSASTIGAATNTGLVELASTSLTTGTLLHLELTEGTLNGGRYLKAWDITAGAEVFSIAENGDVYIFGTAAANAFDIANGDVRVQDGSVTITDADNAATLDITNDTITTGNQIVIVDSTSITTGAVMTLNANTAAHDGEILELISAGDATSTPTGLSVTIASPTTGAAYGINVVMAAATTGPKGIAVTMDAITESDMLYLDNGGGTMTTGYFINCNDDDTTLFGVGADGATTIAATVATTPALRVSGINTSVTMVAFDNASGVQADNTAVVLIDAGGAIASGSNLLRLAPTGTPNAGAIALEIVGASKDMHGILVDMDNTASHAVQIDGSGALNAGRMLLVDNDGTPAAATDAVAEFTFTGTATNNPIVLSVNNSTKDALPLMVNSNVASATREVAMFVQDSATGANEVLSLQQDDVDVPFIDFVTTIGVGNAIEAVGAKSLTTTHFIMVKIPGGLTRYLPVGTIA